VIRIRRRGSHGGHNGLRNINDRIGSEEYPRIKLGVGKKPRPDYDLVDWVLGKMPPADRDALAARAEDADAAVTLILQGRIDEAMNKYSK
jgi:PTH1 family peptidyl-tRNA hydrolase